MATWRKNESLGKVVVLEEKGIAKGVGKGLLSIATLGLYKPRENYQSWKKSRR